MYYVTSQSEKNSQQMDLVLQTSLKSEQIKKIVKIYVNTSQQMSNRMSQINGLNSSVWKRDALAIFYDLPGISQFYILDKQLNILDSTPGDDKSDKTPLVKQLNLNSEFIKSKFQTSEVLGLTHLILPTDKNEAASFGIIISPIQKNKKFHGYLALKIDFTKIIEHFLGRDEEVDFALRIDDKILYQSKKINEKHFQQSNFNYLGFNWNIQAYPTEAMVKSHSYFSKNISLFFGLFISLLLAFVYKFVIRLSDREQEYRDLIDHLPKGAVLLTSNSFFINRTAQNLLGYTSQEIHTIDQWFRILYKEESEHMKKKYLDSKKDGFKKHRIFPVTAKSGQQLYIEFSAYAGSEVEIWVLVDRTEALKYQSELETYKKTVNKNSFIVIFDREGTITECNDLYAQLHNRTREVFLDDSPQFIASNSSYSKIFEVLLRGKTWLGEISIVANSKNNPIWLQCSIVPFAYQRGIPKKFLAISFDITKKKEAETQLVQYKNTLEQQVEARAHFLARISHEIRTPLNGILGLATLILGTEVSRESREHAELIKTTCHGILNTLNDVLDFSKIDAGIIEIKKTRFKIQKALNEIVQLFKPQSLQKKLDLRLIISDDFPETVFTDYHRFKQILTTLLSNAIKYTQKGSVEIQAFAKYSGPNSCLLHIKVIDQGIGIDPDEIDKLLLPFRKGSNDYSLNNSGIGLGLTICNGLIKKLNGHLEINSIPGEGTSFELVLPVEVTVGLAQISTDNLASSSLKISDNNKKEMLVDFDLPDLKVLVAEDDKTNQIITLSYLEKLGFDADLAEDGVEAVKMASYKNYDVIFMDIQMPHMDGHTATIKIREMGTKIRQPYIIAITANAFETDKKLAKESGIDDFIAKPFTHDQLLQSLKNKFSKSSQKIPENPTYIRKDKKEIFVSHERICNIDKVFLRFKDDSDILLKMSIQLLDDFPQYEMALKNAFAEKDFNKMGRTAHTLKSVFHYYEAEKLIQLCSNLESNAKEKDLDAITKNYFEFIKNIPDFLYDIKTLQNTLKLNAS